jgi:hypothetical protein
MLSMEPGLMPSVLRIHAAPLRPLGNGLPRRVLSPAGASCRVTRNVLPIHPSGSSASRPGIGRRPPHAASPARRMRAATHKTITARPYTRSTQQYTKRRVRSTQPYTQPCSLQEQGQYSMISVAVNKRRPRLGAHGWLNGQPAHRPGLLRGIYPCTAGPAFWLHAERQEEQTYHVGRHGDLR